MKDQRYLGEDTFIMKIEEGKKEAEPMLYDIDIEDIDRESWQGIT